MTTHPVLSVGQCSADHASIAAFLQSRFAVEVTPADSIAEALDLLGKQAYALVLVNRILDRDGSEGLDLIRLMQADPQWARTPVMLVSNHAAAQDNAVMLGAAYGFGKQELGSMAAVERLDPFLGTAA